MNTESFRSSLKMTKRASLGVRDLFETHLRVRDLERSMRFFEEVAGLSPTQVLWDPRAAFYWIGGPGKALLGLWEVLDPLERTRQHIAFRVGLRDVLNAAPRLRASGVTPLDFDESPTDEPVVLAWMPAVSIYFHDPDGNLLELVSMLFCAPNPALGVIKWSQLSGELGDPNLGEVCFGN